MASNIDVTKPETGAATTQSVRDNFQAAKNEIEALQTDPVIVDTAVIQSDDATAAAAPFLTLYRNSATPAASDLMGLMRFSGENSAAEQIVYGAVQSILNDPTDGAENGSLSFRTMQGGTLAEVLLIDSSGNGSFAGDLTIAGTLNLTAGALSIDDLTVTTDVTFAGATVADLGTVTTADINGGTIDGTVIGGTTPAAATITDLVVTGTVSLPDDTITIADVDGLQEELDLKAPLESPTFTGTVTVPDSSFSIAKTTGLQTALDLKAPLASPTFTGTVTVPDSSFSIAKTTGLQSALDAKASLSGASFTGNISTTGRGVAGTNTASITGSTTLDFSADQNFVLTMTGDVTLANPTTEAVGQTGFITFIQDGTGGRTLSLGSQFKTANGAGITLSSAADAEDIVPYAVTEDGSIFLGAPQLAFS